MKEVVIILKNKAVRLIPRLANLESCFYYMADDYSYFVSLQEKLGDKVKIKNLSGMLDETFQEIKWPFIELVAKLNKEYNSLEWWGGQVASRSTPATPLLFNITTLFCAKKILTKNSDSGIVFIVDSIALAGCIAKIAAESGYRLKNYFSSIDVCMVIVKRYLRYFAHALYFICKALQDRRVAFKFLKSLPAKKSGSKKRVVLRSWVTKGNFNQFGEFKERNFGILPEWLKNHGYEVWTLPMLFNISMPIKDMYALMGKQKHCQFFLPEHYLKLSDYLQVLASNYKILSIKLEKLEILKTDITPIINEVLRYGFYPSLLLLNLSFLMLKRLKHLDYEIDGFYYPFECNPVEKQFLLSCRKYFPGSKIIGFQHTTFFPNQLAYHLAQGEKDYHPLPDRIICSGPIYVRLHKGSGFPEEILDNGPNLRFESVYAGQGYRKHSLPSQGKRFILPLTFSYNLAFELFVKVRDALKDLKDYRIYIRPHPLLSKDKLEDFLSRIRVTNYEFADCGVIQDWFRKADAVITAGGSITVLEAVVFGIPVIRVIPDNTFFYDPFIWGDYPFKPVNSLSDIRKQIESIDKISADTLSRIGSEVLTQYFTNPVESNLRLFLL